MYHFCTYFDRHYIVRARALYQSLARHVNLFRLYVLCMDDVTYEAVERLALPGVVPISLQAFEEGDEPLLTAKQNRGLLDYYFTCTPSLPLYILDRFPRVDVLTYLDADLFFYGNPDPIFAELGNQSVMIVGHRFPPELRSLERFGIYNVGLLSFRNDASGRECLNWWREQCGVVLRSGRRRPIRGPEVPRQLADAVPRCRRSSTQGRRAGSVECLRQ